MYPIPQSGPSRLGCGLHHVPPPPPALRALVATRSAAAYELSFSQLSVFCGPRDSPPLVQRLWGGGVGAPLVRPLDYGKPEPMRWGGRGQGRRTTVVHRRAKRALVYADDTAKPLRLYDPTLRRRRAARGLTPTSPQVVSAL